MFPSSGLYIRFESSAGPERSVGSVLGSLSCREVPVMPPTCYAADPLCRRSVMPPTRYVANPLCRRPAMSPIRYAADPLCRRPAMPPTPIMCVVPSTSTRGDQHRSCLYDIWSHQQQVLYHHIDHLQPVWRPCLLKRESRLNSMKLSGWCNDVNS